MTQSRTDIGDEGHQLVNSCVYRRQVVARARPQPEADDGFELRVHGLRRWK